VKTPTAIAAFVLFLASVLVPTELLAQGLPVDTGSHAPVALWFVGAFVLAGAIVYGIMRNRQRSRAEMQLTERATKENYRRESQND
jgi:hypothetical protein